MDSTPIRMTSQYGMVERLQVAGNGAQGRRWYRPRRETNVLHGSKQRHKKKKPCTHKAPLCLLPRLPKGSQLTGVGKQWLHP